MKKKYIKIILFVFIVHLLPLFIMLSEISDNLTDFGEVYEGWMSFMIFLDFPVSLLLLIFMYFQKISILFYNIYILMAVFQIFGTINWILLISTILCMNPIKKRIIFLFFIIGFITGIMTLVLDFFYNMNFDAILCITLLTICTFSGIYLGLITTCGIFVFIRNFR
jgi:hypothetical protein